MSATRHVQVTPGGALRRDDVLGLLVAIRDFHRLRCRRERGEQTTQEEADRLRELRDLLEPRRPGCGARTRFEVVVNERAIVTAGGYTRPARLKMLGLRRIELKTDDSVLTPGERVVLSVPRSQESFHFHVRVVRSRRDGSVTAEILAASLDG